MDKAKLERNLFISRLMRVYFGGVCMAIPSIVGYWTEHGLSFADITLLQAYFAVGMVLMEVPTGYFADCMGRKNSMIAAGAFLGLGEAVYALANDFFGFLAGELLLAAAFAFASGADDALIRSSLRVLGREGQYVKTISKLKCFGFIAMAVSGSVGGVLSTWNSTLPFWCGAFLGLLAFISALFLYEPKSFIRDNRKMSVLELFEMAKTAFYKNKSLAWLMLFSACFNAWLRMSVWIYQPYFEKGGLLLAEIGLIFSAFHLAAALGSKFLAPYFAKSEASWGSLLLVVATAYLLMGFWVLPVCIWALPMIHQMTRGILSVCFSGQLEKEVAEEDFATFTSLQSFSAQLAYASVVPLFGTAVDKGGIESTLLSVALAGFAVCFLVLCFKPKH